MGIPAVSNVQACVMGRGRGIRTARYSEHQKSNSDTCYCDKKGELFFTNILFSMAFSIHYNKHLPVFKCSSYWGPTVSAGSSSLLVARLLCGGIQFQYLMVGAIRILVPKYLVISNRYLAREAFHW